jgi:uncharacterized membrane protein YdjX (TVP38/TMEM64 family)
MCVIAGVVGAIARPAEMQAAVGAVLDMARGAGRFGVALFVIAQVLVAVSGLLPASLLGAAAGAIYGLEAGFALAAFSTLLGAYVAFAAARGLMRGFAERVLRGRPRLRELDELVASDGWRIVCLLRMSPVMPFSATSYALGFSSVSASDYLIGTLAAMPALFGYVLLGALTQDWLLAGAGGANPIRLTLLGLGIVATIGLTLRLGHFARKAGVFRRKASAASA